MSQYARAVTVVFSLLLSGSSSGAAQQAQTAEVLVLGTWHFENPGLDLVRTEIADVLEPENQAQVLRIAESLARFQPTVILVEQQRSTAQRLDSLYAAYRAGAYELPRNEVHQLGFRLAGMRGLDGVIPIDEGGEFPFGELMAYASQHDPAAAAYVAATLDSIKTASALEHRELSIVEHMRLSNDPARLRQGHGIYVRLNRVGASDGFAGADLLASWYERNIRIFANIQKHATAGERVLVIFGSGHVPILRELIAYDPTLRLVEALDYLPAEQP